MRRKGRNGNNYVRIFDHLDKQDSYDEEVLFKKFDGEAFLNRFSITKKRFVICKFKLGMEQRLND